MARSKTILFQNDSVDILRRRFQRTINLLVKPSGRLKVTSGKTVSDRQILHFLDENLQWIEKSRAQLKELHHRYPQKEYRDGERFLFLGEWLTLTTQSTQKKRARARRYGDQLIIEEPQINTEIDRQETVRRFYQKEGRELLTQLVEVWSERMGLFPAKISLRSQKSRWGSCSSQKRISLNWRLVAFSREVAEYVVIHELAHLRHPNHSPQFWALVAKHCSKHEKHRQTLRRDHFEVDFLAAKSDLHN